MSGDYSRKTFKAKKNYSGVLMQQGRVQLDADWNEQVAINLRRQRAQTVDTIGRAVVPMETPDGFKLVFSALGLNIHPGRMYVDGLLAENHGAIPSEFYSVLDEERGSQPVLYSEQPYFPNVNDIAPLPGFGTGIAYLDVWQREVTYVKQPGLVEPAVGVDTTARWQTVWQVKVLEVDTTDGEELECLDQVDAWDTLIAASAGRLSTEIVDTHEEENVCLVPGEGGYRALENRLYRVEVHIGGDFNTAKFKWSRHNASIESAVHQISGTELTVAQAQWDAIRRFNIGDWVEVTDNVREFSGVAGVMRQIDDVDYTQNIISLNSALPAGNFPTDGNDAPVPDRHTRIIRWDQKNDVDMSTGLVAIDDSPVYLEDGIQISFTLNESLNLSGEFKVGDYWVFYARSATAKIEILDKAPPRGIHHHYARLAILDFQDQQQEDCRILWPPEFAHASCCTISVGDGENSFGQFNSIQEAINQLPATGGKICVLPGRYFEHVTIKGKENIIISGCGERTQLIATNERDHLLDPVILVEDSNNIFIETLSIAANNEAEGIYIRETTAAFENETRSYRNRSIVITELNLSAGESSAIRCDQAIDIIIQNCSVSMRDVSTEWPGIFVIGTKVLIEKNTVIATKPILPIEINRRPNLPGSARGGIQIGGNSDQVRVINNVIKNGMGDGITLGSLSLIKSNEDIEKEVMFLFVLANAYRTINPCEPCSPPPIRIPPRYEIDDNSDEIPEPLTIISAGSLYDIVIENNRIEDMGRNGIGVVGFFDLDESDEFISVENLHIGHNHIESCLNRILPTVDTELEDDIGYGGIVLADVLNLLIHDNDILNNGLNHTGPICGIYVLHGEGVEICDNRIINNGEKLSDDTGDEKRGARSGIHLVYVITPTVPLFPNNQKLNYPRQNGVPAAKVHNNVVSHPVGRALTINALGPVSVTDNQLTSRGVLTGQASAIAGTVAILNLGISNEFYLQLASFAQMAKGQVNLNSIPSRIKKSTVEGVAFAQAGLDDFKIGRYLANGNVLFANNQVILDEFDTKTNIALSAVTIMSLDDIAFHGNQCDYSLWGDFLVFPNFIFAPSVRVADNRFKESFYGAFISGVTFGLMNTTTSNQATHCLLVVGNPKLRIDEHNIVLADAIFPPIITGNQSFTYCELIKAQVRKTFNLGERL